MPITQVHGNPHLPHTHTHQPLSNMTTTTTGSTTASAMSSDISMSTSGAQRPTHGGGNGSVLGSRSSHDRNMSDHVKTAAKHALPTPYADTTKTVVSSGSSM